MFHECYSNFKFIFDIEVAFGSPTRSRANDHYFYFRNVAKSIQITWKLQFFGSRGSKWWPDISSDHWQDSVVCFQWGLSGCCQCHYKWHLEDRDGKNHPDSRHLFKRSWESSSRWQDVHLHPLGPKDSSCPACEMQIRWSSTVDAHCWASTCLLHCCVGGQVR
jgi:hypothetical protein